MRDRLAMKWKNPFYTPQFCQSNLTPRLKNQTPSNQQIISPESTNQFLPSFNSTSPPLHSPIHVDHCDDHCSGGWSGTRASATSEEGKWLVLLHLGFYWAGWNRAVRPCWRWARRRPGAVLWGQSRREAGREGKPSYMNVGRTKLCVETTYSSCHISAKPEWNFLWGNLFGFGSWGCVVFGLEFRGWVRRVKMDFPLWYVSTVHRSMLH